MDIADFHASAVGAMVCYGAMCRDFIPSTALHIIWCLFGASGMYACKLLMMLHLSTGRVACCYYFEVGYWNPLCWAGLPLCRACTGPLLQGLCLDSTDAYRTLCIVLVQLWSGLVLILWFVLWRSVWWPYPLWFGARLLFWFRLLDCLFCIKEHLPFACSKEPVSFFCLYVHACIHLKWCLNTLFHLFLYFPYFFIHLSSLQDLIS